MNEEKKTFPNPTEDEDKNKQFHLANTGETLNLRGEEQLAGAKAYPVPKPTRRSAERPSIPEVSKAETFEEVQKRWAGRPNRSKDY